jgi:hypothetical protein
MFTVLCLGETNKCLELVCDPGEEEVLPHIFVDRYAVSLMFYPQEFIFSVYPGFIGFDGQW